MASAIVLKRDDASWRHAHEALVRLAAERAGLDFEEGAALLRAQRSGAHVRLGFASFNEYIERLLGYGPKLTQEKLRVAVALEALPETTKKLQTGAINFSVARELTRVALPSTEKEWLGAARGRTVRDVEHLVSGHRTGSLPDDVPDSRLERHVLKLELSGEVLATFREAMAKIRRDAGEPLDDDKAILLLCRQALEGARDRDPGRASYQIALTVCESCRRATQQGRGELIEVGCAVVEMAECDAQHIGHVDAHVGVQARDDVRADVEARDEAAVRLRVGAATAGLRAHVGIGDAAVHADIGVWDHAAAPGDVGDRFDARRCAAAGVARNAHVGEFDDSNHRAHVRANLTRATQTIPPAKRRAVLHRDAGRCRVPGCRHAVFTDVHHIRLRSEDGRHDLENLVTLCGAHHAAVHEGRVIVTGTASHLSVTHADGTPYGGAVGLAVADARAKAFQALVGLGFREGEAKGALARTPSTLLSVEQLVRRALRELAPQ